MSTKLWHSCQCCPKSFFHGCMLTSCSGLGAPCCLQTSWRICHLVSLNLARTGLALQQEPDQPDGISALAGKLQHAPHLTELCLADNNMTASGARALLQQGSTCLSRLTLLDLSHNYERGPHGMVGTVGPAIKYLKDCPQLTELNLTCCTLLATGHVRLGK